MRLRIPDHYKDFKCTADRCRKNCCRGGWDIEVDPDTEELFRKSPDAKKLTSSLRRKGADTFFKTGKNGCVWLDEKGLCRLYGEYGQEYQATVCRQFPRFTEYFGEIKETGLGLGCEEAARILFSCRRRPELVSEDTYEEAYEDSGFDGVIAEAVFEVRQLLLGLLYRDDLPVGTRLGIMTEICGDFQDLLNDDVDQLMQGVEGIRKIYGGKTGTADVTEEGLNDSRAVHTPKMPFHLYKEGYEAVICVFEELPDIRKDMEKLLSRTRRFMDRHTGEKLEKTLKEFDAYMEKEDRSHEYEAFLWYLVFRYFAKTVYDRDASLKGSLFAVFYLFLRLSDAALWEENSKKFTFAHRVENAEVFSREVEYSEDNMEQIFEMFLFEEDLDVDMLKKLL